MDNKIEYQHLVSTIRNNLAAKARQYDEAMSPYDAIVAATGNQPELTPMVYKLGEEITDYARMLAEYVGKVAPIIVPGSTHRYHLYPLNTDWTRWGMDRLRKSEIQQWIIERRSGPAAHEENCQMHEQIPDARDCFVCSAGTVDA